LNPGKLPALAFARLCITIIYVLNRLFYETNIIVFAVTQGR
jgi:hypothetical protein